MELAEIVERRPDQRDQLDQTLSQGQKERDSRTCLSFGVTLFSLLHLTRKKAGRKIDNNSLSYNSDKDYQSVPLKRFVLCFHFVKDRVLSHSPFARRCGVCLW